MTWWHRYWSEATVPASTLIRFRLLFFPVLALDAWQQIRHAPRYGSGLAVPHFPWTELFLPAPTRTAMLTIFVLEAYLALRIALGAGVVFSLRALTLVYGYAYFVSQLDSYQHHYLVFLVLCVSCAMPWKEAEEGGDRVPGWAVRLVSVVLALVYAWAAFSKLDSLWLSGRTLSWEVASPTARGFIVGLPGGWATAAWLVLGLEVALAILLLVPGLGVLPLLVAVVLHVGIALAGLEIGMFAWLMLALYVALLLPETWSERFSRLVRPARDWLAALATRFASRASNGAVALALGVALGALATLVIPLPVFPFILVCAAVPIALGIRRPSADRLREGLAHAAACLVLLGLHAVTSESDRYCRHLIADALRRDVAMAETEYCDTSE